MPRRLRFGRASGAQRRDAPAPTPPVEEDVLRTAAHPGRVAFADASGPTVLGGRYELGRALGRGGEASVHLARDLVLGRDVAIKLFHTAAVPPSESGLRAMEARVVASLSHPALTTLFDAGIDEGPGGEARAYLVMEYVDGESLRERLRRGAMTVSEACWLGFDVAEGLDHTHQAGFIHRDVKPANILISARRSARPVVAKLTDFGIAAPIGQPDISEFTVGTAAYLSPEQVEGNDAVPESDTYSLGLVLLEAMTGRQEFRGSVEQAAFARLSRDPEIPDTIPAPVGDLLRRMTARAPAQRVPLHQAAIELQQFLVDDLVRRRTAATPAAAGEMARTAAQPVSGLLGPERLTVTLRLVCCVAHVPRALLVVGSGEHAAVEAHRGWRRAPSIARLLPAGRRTSAAPWTTAAAAEEDRPDADDDPIGAIAAVPLLDATGAVLGTLLAVAGEPREFRDDELDALTDIGLLLVQAMALQTAVRRVIGRAD